MRKYLLFAGMCMLLLSLVYFHHHFLAQKRDFSASTMLLPHPEEGEENEKQRTLYEELRHRSAPNTNWQQVEAANAKATISLLRQQGARVMESFANGAISGTWSERGAANQTGNIRAVDYVPASNKLYTISNGGSLWSSVLGSGTWSLLNQRYRFNQRCISAFTKTGGGVRIVISIGEQVMYSDDEGANFIPATGISFPVAWGGNYVAQFIHLNDGSNTIYCLTRPWSDVPWGPRFWLYRSTDQGASFSKIYAFNAGDDTGISLSNPYNTTAVYAADLASVPGTLNLYNVSGATVSLLNSKALGTGNVPNLLKGTNVGGITTLYLLVNNNTIYRSTDFGANWELRSHLPENAWMKMNVSINNPDLVSYGGVNAYRSIDGGANFIKVNDWAEYYGNVSQKLHADIMEIEYFKKADNTEFAVIDCHGGTYTSYDNLTTVSNQSLASHYATEYYDLLTDTFHLNRIYVGTQDQGLQRTLTGTTLGIQPFKQLISGDYGQMALTGNGQILWPQYPGGTFYFFTDLGNATPTYIGSWTMGGTQKPNYGWMLPVTATADASANEIWMGGGNITGGGGSYLVKLSMLSTPPYTVTPVQLPYDFRANSTSGNAGITAIEQSLINTSKLFVATEDGSFFYSTNGGTSWTRTASFIGPTPWYLYGSTILASRKNENLVWYGGSGYSNPPVYVSTNGGSSFTPMSDGLPPTLVNEIVASPDEEFLFAATDAGPYIYVNSVSKWFPLISNNMPIQFFSGVEYLAAQKIVRFSTMGRGVWDLTLNSSPLPVTLLQFDGQYQNRSAVLNWSTSSESNSSHFLVQRSVDGVQFNNVGKVSAAGSSNSTRQYHYTDNLAWLNRSSGEVYYRLQQVDRNGEEKASKIVKLKITGNSQLFTLLNNPVHTTAKLQLQSTLAGPVTIRLYDASGKAVMTKQFEAAVGNNQFQLDTNPLSSGVYTAELQTATDRLTVRLLKQ